MSLCVLLCLPVNNWALYPYPISDPHVSALVVYDLFFALPKNVKNIRTQTIDGEPWICAFENGVCAMLRPTPNRTHQNGR